MPRSAARSGRILHFVPVLAGLLLVGLLLVGLLLLPACAPRKPAEVAPGFRALDSGAARSLAGQLTPGLQGLSSWRDLEPTLRRSLAYVASRPQVELAVDRPGLRLPWSALRGTLEALLADLPALDRDPGLLARDFTWFALEPRTLLTGYYEPWLAASPVPDPAYPHPLYGVPADLKVVDLGRFLPRWKGQQLTYRLEGDGIAPYYDRQAIDFGGALKDRGLEVAWARDLVDVFFLQVQGSGRLLYPDGTVRHVLYAGKNGREFVSLGKVLAQRGLLPREKITMQSIRAVLAAHPDMLPELLSTNPSYVFFRLSDSGPFGSAGQVLTPMASAAVDRKTMPLGAVLALDSHLPEEAPDGRVIDGERFFGLLSAQDTGGAIKETRVDLFCGSGRRAEDIAGRLQAEARVYVLVARRFLPPSD